MFALEAVRQQRVEPGRAFGGDLLVERRPAAGQRLGELRVAQDVALRRQRIQAVHGLEVAEPTTRVVVETDEDRLARDVVRQRRRNELVVQLLYDRTRSNVIVNSCVIDTCGFNNSIDICYRCGEIQLKNLSILLLKPQVSVTQVCRWWAWLAGR